MYLIVSLTASPSRKSQNIVMLILSIFTAVFIIIQLIFIRWDWVYSPFLTAVWYIPYVANLAALVVFAIRRKQLTHLNSNCLRLWQIFVMIPLVTVAFGLQLYYRYFALHCDVYIYDLRCFDRLYKVSCASELCMTAYFCFIVRGAATCDLSTDNQVYPVNNEAQAMYEPAQAMYQQAQPVRVSLNNGDDFGIGTPVANDARQQY